ncbi:MAG TPA: hypothetical protein VGG38_08490 [Acidimicrobiales bacterium]|jgi:hypothetical protein
MTGLAQAEVMAFVPVSDVARAGPGGAPGDLVACCPDSEGNTLSLTQEGLSSNILG